MSDQTGGDNLLTDLLALERAGWQALSDGTAGAFYEEHLSDDAVMIFPFGVMPRADAIAAMAEAAPWTEFGLANTAAHRISTDSAAIIYQATARRGSDEPYTAWMTTVFTRHAKRWVMALHQQSPAS